MNRREFLLAHLAVGATSVFAQRAGLPPKRNAGNIEKQVEALIKKMSLEEKVQFLRGDGDFSSRGNARLGLPGISMADSPQGVRVEGNATVFPSPVAMAASWNADLIYRVGAALGRELKAKGRDVLLGPCVNIHRSPLGGRNVESFGEDPFLSGSTAAAYVKGVQSENVAACVKHYAANNIETRRLFLDVRADLRYLHEIELPPFRMAVREGGARAVMASYNLVNGHYSWANRYLLTDVLRRQWNFKGVIVSDWGCEWMLPETRSAVESVDAGLNIHMPQGYYYNEPLIKLVREGKVREASIDKLVKENLIVIHELGLVGKKKTVDQTQADTAAHHRLARETAAESIVLLKNEQKILPLDRNRIKTLAVIGPNAAVARLGDRGSVYAPTSYTVSPLEGLRNKLGDSVRIVHAPGYRIENFKTIPKNALQTADGKRGGLLGEFFGNKDFQGAAISTEFAEILKFDWGANVPKEFAKEKTFAARWSGRLLAPRSKIVFLGLKSDGASKLYVDGRLLIENIGTWTEKLDPQTVKYARIDLRAGEARAIRVEYHRGEKNSAIELVWADAPENPFFEATSAAKNADCAVIFAGLNIDHEGEGLDRFDMNLPELQNELIAAVAAANPKTVVVINSGTPNDLTGWIDRVPAVLQAWYPGIEGGNAVADVLLGDVNPSGKLPVTFGKRREDYADYPFSEVVNDRINYGESIFVGYRHFDRKKIAPLFAFGHGLSYTDFAYGELQVRADDKNKSLKISIDVKNTGRRAGREVVQLYVGDIVSRLARPPKELKGFRKIKLAPGASERVSFTLNRDDLSYFEPSAERWIFEPGKFEVLVGSSSGDIRARQMAELS